MADNVRLAELERKLADADRKREAMEARLMASERQRHVDNVEAFLTSHINRGLPPAVVPYLRGIMLNSAPSAEAVIKLDDNDEASPVMNLYGLITKLADIIPHLPVDDSRTISDEGMGRPPNAQGVSLADDQIKLTARDWLQSAGLLVDDNKVPVRSKRRNEPASIDGDISD